VQPATRQQRSGPCAGGHQHPACGQHRTGYLYAFDLSVSDPAPLHRDLTGTEREPDRWQPDWIVEKYFGG